VHSIFKDKTDLIETVVKNTDTVLDVGFYGQGVNIDDDNWVHNLLLNRAHRIYGIDLDYDESRVVDKERYKRASAEDFAFDVRFDVIFAGDVIEHLSNPGLFLDCCRANLKEDGRLIITTPNCFNLFNIAEKIGKKEPTVNHDHTFYFNNKTLRQLLKKNGWETFHVDHLYSLDVTFKESIVKKILNVVYFCVSKLTTKYIETLVVTARPIGDTTSR
jgi:2-polyprenyl-3-methyl-5-hydroxy-6-metoxy-1,4-benzoquinol methylase